MLIGYAVTKEKSKKPFTTPTPKEEKALSRDDVESITRKIVDESFNRLAEEKLTIANTTITYSSIIVVVLIGSFTMFSLIFGFLAYLGQRSVREARDEIEKLRKLRATMEKKLQNVEDTLNELEEDATNIWSRFNTHLGYTCWEINSVLSELGRKNQLLPKQKEQKNLLLKRAIQFTEAAINPDKLDKNLRKEAGLVTAKSNLAYFYAKLKENREDALNHIKSVEESIRTLNRYEKINEKYLPHWLTSCAFVKMRFADSLKEINEVISFLEHLRHRYKDEPELEKEIDSYLTEAIERRLDLSLIW